MTTIEVHLTVDKDYMRVKKETIDKLKSKRWWKDYHIRLQNYLESNFPGSHLVAFPVTVSQIEELFKVNPVIPKKCVSLNGAMNADCHDNCRKLRNAGLIHMYGYALSADGLWRNHSWGILNGIVVETTEPRLAYLGIDLE